MRPIIQPSSSILPRLRIRSFRRMFGNMLRHHLQQFAGGYRLPAVALHRAAIFESAFVMRVFGMLQKILEVVHRKVQVKVIVITYIHMQFVYKLRPKCGPVFSEVIAQVVSMFAGIVHGVAVYFACKVIP